MTTGTHQAQVMATVPPGGERHGGRAVATRWPHRVVEVLGLLTRKIVSADDLIAAFSEVGAA